MKKSFLSFFSISVFGLLLLGAGCSQTANRDNNLADREPLVDTTLEQKAYLFCTQKGYTTEVRFDSEVNRNRLFCIFERGLECDAIDFMNEKCDKKTKLAEREKNDVGLSPNQKRFTCEPAAKPVCATDGKTYTNRCIAETQGKTVKYEGVCSESEEPFVQEPLSNSQKIAQKIPDTAANSVPERTASWPAASSPSSERSESTAPRITSQPPESTPSGTPEWVYTLTSLLEGSSSPYSIILSECKESATRYFYQKEDCPNCFKVLYNEQGETLCYPGNEVGAACPVWRESNCKEIWKK